MNRLGTKILTILFAGMCLLPATALDAAPNAFRLTLDDVSRLALTNNFDIQLAKYDAWIARTDEGVARSIFDTMLTGDFGYRKDKSKKTSTIFGSKTVTHDYNVGASKKLPTGTTLAVDMFNQRNFTNSSFVTSPLTHESTLEVSIEQALGRNFFGIQDRGDVKLTLIDIENSEYTSLDKIQDELASVQKAYWDLVLKRERAFIARDMVAQAKRLYDLNREKLEDGLVERPDVLAAEANYKKRLNELRLRENDVRSGQSVLRLALNITDDDLAIEATQTFTLPDQKEILETSMRKAFENRWDYKKVLNEIESKDIELSMNKNSLWPEINLEASLARNGLGDHFDDSVGNISDETNPDFFAGLRVEFPLENSRAKAELKATELEKAQTLLNFKFIERRIAVEVKDQVRDCNVFREVASNEVQIAEVQREKLEEELKRFHRGRSDTDTVVRFQEDVLQARLDAAQAKLRYFNALVDLRVRESTLLRDYWDGSL